jgi:hypothetical protein
LSIGQALLNGTVNVADLGFDSLDFLAGLEAVSISGGVLSQAA